MENEIRILKNKTGKKYNNDVDFILNQGILKGWRFTVDSVLILKDDIIVTIKLNNYTVNLSGKDFTFSLCFNNRIYINHLEIQNYCKKGGNNG